MSLSLWGNDTAAHLVEDQTMAEKGAVVPDLYFSLISEPVIHCVLLAQNRHTMAQNPQLKQHSQQFVCNTSRLKCACCL